MELLMPRVKKDKVFLFDGSLGAQVWEAEPITRFWFKKPVENEWIREQLSANKPTAGLLFDGKIYIGTNDGMIYVKESEKDRKINRIPQISVDTDLFIEQYNFKSEKEKKAFLAYQKKGASAVNFKDRQLTERIFEISDQLGNIKNQNANLDRY